LHGTKDYLDLVLLLARYPKLHQTVNLVPSLILQIEDYVAGKAFDPYLEVALTPTEQLSDRQRQFILETGYVPSRRELFHDPQIVAKYRHYPQLLEVVEKAVLRPPVSQYGQASDTLKRYLSAALTERLSPQQAMEAAADETRKMLGRFQTAKAEVIAR
jgi:alpha-amylase/alpha-mannosidase (GH57 family)